MFVYLRAILKLFHGGSALVGIANRNAIAAQDDV